MNLLPGRRVWMVGGLLGYVLLVLIWSAASGVRASPGTSPPARGNSAAKAAVFSEPTSSSPIALSADKNFVWVVNPDDDSLSVIRTDTDEVVARITNVGDEPQGVAVDPNNQYAYVANAASNNVTVIRITGTSPFGAVVHSRLNTGAEPWNVVVSPNGQRVFVSNSGQDTITVINSNVVFPASPSIIGNVNLRSSACNIGDQDRHFQPRGMAVSLNNDQLYVTRFLSFTGGATPKQSTNNGKVGVICRVTLPVNPLTLPTVFTPIQLAPAASGFLGELAYPNQLQSIVIRDDDAYMPNIAAAPAAPLAFNGDTHAFLNRISGVGTGTQTDEGALNLHLGARDPEGAAPNEKTKLFFSNLWAIAFTNQSGNGSAYAVSAGSDLLVKLSVNSTGVISFTGTLGCAECDQNTARYIDLNDPLNAATSGANAGKNPLGIVLRNIAPGNNKAYVMNYISRNVSVVNLDTDSVQKVIALTSLPVPGSEDEVLQIGKEIFFSARGVFNGGKFNRLSSEGWQNCASCHFAGLTDGNAWAFGAGPRKSIPLNGTWSPHNPDDQRVLNYSAIFDEVQDFELNIRNVSGPGNLPAPAPAGTLDPNHGLLIGNDGNIDAAPTAVNAFALPNAGRQQLTVTLPGSTVAVPALDAMKEWVRLGIRTPNGALTTTELSRDTDGGGPNQGNPNTTGGLNPANVAQGRTLFFRAGCQTCHGGTKWSNSSKDFISPPDAGDISTETNPAPPAGVTPVGTQFLNAFLKPIGSFDLGSAANPIANNVGGAEVAATGQAALGKDHNVDLKGDGYNIPSLLAIEAVPPYYHNGSCETLACVVGNARHRTANNTRADVLTSPTSRANLVEFLRSLDAETVFPTNLSIVAHNIFLDPPTVFQGTQVTIGANLNLFGTKADLNDLLNGGTLKVRFTGPGLDSVVDVSAFDRDFGQATATTVWNVPADVRRAVIVVTIDTTDVAAEANERDNSARRTLIVRPPPPDTTPPAVSEVRISDNDPFNDNDAVTNTATVRVKFRVTNTPSVSPAPTTDLDSFCIVRYTYNSVLRRWVEEPCRNFLRLPAANGDGSFTVETTLPSRAGAVYAFVWVRDAEGNISRQPGFDFISFVPGPDVVTNIRRNEVRVFRIRLDTSQTLNMTFTSLLGDVDVSVFDAAGNRIQVSADNGLTPEQISLSSVADNTTFHVEVRAVVNSRFTIQTNQPSIAGRLATGSVIASGKADLPDTPINLGPPPVSAAIETNGDLFLPFVAR